MQSTIWYSASTVWLVVCSTMDWRTRRIPLALTLPAMILGMVRAAWLERWWFLACWALIYALWWMHALGGGDAKILMALTALRPEVETLIVLLGAITLGGAGVLLWNAAHRPRSTLLAVADWVGTPATVGARVIVGSLDRRKLARSARWRATWTILIGWLALWALAVIQV